MSGDVFPVGTTTVMCTVTDRDGNTATCDYDVTVVDNESPVITVACPADITIGNDAGLCAAAATWTPPTLEDNCPGAIISSTHNPGDIFQKGTTEVTYAITDAAGNTTTCSFNVTVEDTEPATITCPANIVVDADPLSCDAVVTWTIPIPVDNCPDALVTATNTPGETFPVGTTTVTYTVTDCGGNVTTCSFDITVNDAEDPTITCPADVTVNNDPGVCEAVVTWTAPVASDNCLGETVTSTANSGDTFPVGTTTVTYTITDAAGNTATCSFDVTVNDIEDPTITCPANITVSTDTGACEAVVTWTALVTSDNCPGEMVTSTASSGDTFPLGTTTVTYTITDVGGNIVTCSFDVTVEDNEPPTVANCPTDITVANDPGTCFAIVNWFGPTFNDNCMGGSVVGTNNSGDIFQLGTTVVSYTITDAAGNVEVCSFNVTVEDTENPTITCPADITASTDCDSAVVNWAVTNGDNCPGEMVVCTSNPGDTYPLGTTTVTCTVTDAAGNTAMCNFDITVNDDVPEPLDCSAINGVRPTDAGVCTYTAQGGEFDPTSSATCPGVTLTNDINNTATLSGEVFPKGTTPVVWTITDAGGNMTTCEIEIIVNDEADDYLSC